MDILKYKGYEGTTELDMDRFVCRGKLLFIDDLVTYEAATPKELKQEFEAAVEDYLETCAFLGRESKKPLKGQFNVRISSALHKEAVMRGLRDGVPLNGIVTKAIESYLSAPQDINQNISITIKESETFMATSSTTPILRTIPYVQ